MSRKIDPALIPPKPDLYFENALWEAGCQLIAGVDEAGRGPLAGPVMAALVILPQINDLRNKFSGVQDSKQLSFRERARLREIVEDQSLAWAVGSATNIEIDQFGIMPGTRLAVQRALNQCKLLPDHLLVDYIVLPNISLPQTRLVKGDARSLSIACASILAKTHRDDFMIQASREYPDYGFDRNKGYGTAGHCQAIRDHGPTLFHRMSFAPIKDLDN
jgi:ribonuclease HII